LKESKGLGRKFAKRSVALELEWPLQQLLWDLVAGLDENTQVRTIDNL